MLICKIRSKSSRSHGEVERCENEKTENKGRVPDKITSKLTALNADMTSQWLSQESLTCLKLQRDQPNNKEKRDQKTHLLIRILQHKLVSPQQRRHNHLQLQYCQIPPNTRPRSKRSKLSKGRRKTKRHPYLGPTENGLNVLCINATSPSAHLSGLYTSTSSPHTCLSRWIEKLGTLTTAPSGKCLPQMSSPPSGTIRGRPKAEVEWMRSASLMHASR